MGKQLELLVAMQSMLWGGWLLLPSDSFSVSQVYTFMRFEPEWVWGACMFIFGLLSLLYVLEDKNNTKRKTTGRLHIARFGAFLWTFITISFILGNYASTAIPNGVSIVVTYFVIMYNLSLFQKGIK